MKILLVSPANVNSPERGILKALPFLGKEAFFAPHACAAVAALTPEEHEVRIHDEAVHGPVEPILEQETFDIVGMSLVADAYVRAFDIANAFRESKRPGILVAGGACMLHMVSKLRDIVDVVFVGESEETWPKFLEEYAEGRHAAVYRQIAKRDLSNMPVPRWELLQKDLARYTVAAVQTVRGCPHDCTFCDVIYNFGRTLRFKPIDQVIEEIRLLESLGVEMIFFADDNFAANRSHTKEILRRIVEANKSFKFRISFATQVDITVSEDDELLQLMLDANFLNLQIGIESVHPESLKDLHKQHNLRYDLAEAVRHIQSYGIVVLAHMIFGTDSDDHQVFDRSERFLSEANIVHHASHPLMAPPGTQLWYELRQDGRLVDVSPEMQDKLDVYTNIVPKQMSRDALISGLADYRLRVSAPERFLERARGFAAGVTHRVSFKVLNPPPLWHNLKMLFRMVKYYLFRAEKTERRIFFRLLRETGAKYAHLMPSIFYALVCHLMERKQAEIKATWAVDIVAQESALPEGPSRMSRQEVMAPAVRENFRQIASSAYHVVRGTVSDRETLYRVVLTAIFDYALTFGDSFETFDDYQLDALTKSCRRRMGQTTPTTDASDIEMPEDKPPVGFAREILDSLDQTLRFELEENPA